MRDKQKFGQNFIISFLCGIFGSLAMFGFVIGVILIYPPKISLLPNGKIILDGMGKIGLFKKIENKIGENGENKENCVKQEFATAQDAIVNAVKRSNPAVVSIVITKDVPIIERYYEDSPRDFNDPFGDFFGGGFSPFNFRVPKYREKGTEKKEIGGGSGFLVSADGMIVTNKHVVDIEKAEYTVFTNDGKKHEAKVVARDPLNDIAIIKIEGENFSYLNFADSDKLEVGQAVIAIGNALGEFRNTVSAGVISGLSRSITAGDGFGQAEQLKGVIQTDAAINRGNSGGPLLNLDGEVIGVNVAMAAGSENIGFALPANTIKSVVESVKKNGKIVRPFLGVRYLPITDEVKKKNRLNIDYGALVVRGESRDELAVTPGSAADKAGIEENDIILEVDGVKLDSEHSLSKIIANKKVGDVIKLKVLHKGEEKELEATLGEMSE